jgi:nicotinate-nucleotide pyrophosphorylase (carboxylating)
MTFASNSPTSPEPLDTASYRDQVRRALAEDVGAGDRTTRAIVPADAAARATILAGQPCILAGAAVAREVFRQVEPALVFAPGVADGEACSPGTVVAEVTGSAGAILTAERTALNFLQHLSGIATLTRRFVEAAGPDLTVLDTRKTIPGMRALAKYAVRCGGGTNHRFGLHDGVLIKDNHIRLAGGVAEAVRQARAAEPGAAVEVEAEGLDDVDRALDAGADVIMLDNLGDDVVRQALARIGGRARVEVSGGVTLERIGALAALGADAVSVGALTHSAPAVDFSLDLEAAG